MTCDKNYKQACEICTDVACDKSFEQACKIPTDVTCDKNFNKHARFILILMVRLLQILYKGIGESTPQFL